MTLKKVTLLLPVLMCVSIISHAQQSPLTSGDVTVRLSEPISFVTARPLQAVRSVILSSTNPEITPGGIGVLQVQNRDGSFTLKLLRVVIAGQVFKTMSQPGRALSGSPASGQNTSLAAGVALRFTLTQEDGTLGPPVQQAVKPTAMTTPAAVSVPSSSASGGSSKDRSNFEMEGVKLGMTLANLLAAERAFAPKTTQKAGTSSVSFKTADLEFVVMFSKAGILNRMDIFSRTKTTGNDALSDLKRAAATSAVYKKAIQVFGPPDDASTGDEASWAGGDGSSAGYYLDGDTVEVLAKQ